MLNAATYIASYSRNCKSSLCLVVPAVFTVILLRTLDMLVNCTCFSDLNTDNDDDDDDDYLSPVEHKTLCSISALFPVSEKLAAWIRDGRQKKVRVTVFLVHLLR